MYKTPTTIQQRESIAFPPFSGVRCLMMPYIQGDPASVPGVYGAYYDIIKSVFLKKGDIGFLTIDESVAVAGKAHRGARAKHGRALHTEAGWRPKDASHVWGGHGWGDQPNVRLDPGVRILLANNLNGSCAVWDAIQADTTYDGDIGHLADQYPYSDAILMKAGEVHEIGILTPHESLPVKEDFKRQFLRIVSSGVHGREPYFTENPLVTLN